MKKVFLIILTSVLLLFGSGAPTLISIVSAQTPSPWYNQNFFEFSDKVFDENSNEIFGERYTYAQITWILNSLLAIFTGVRGADLLQIIESINSGGDGSVTYEQIEAMPISAGIKGMFSILTFPYSNMPASGLVYIGSLFDKFTLVQPAYAQAGFGFSALSMILPLWRAVRNLAYVLLTLVAIVIAFTVMFRKKISPQVEVAVTSAVPKLVIATVLITFSYAIAGFLIDLMYLFFFVIIFGLFSFGGLPSNTFGSLASVTDWVEVFSDSNIGGAAWKVLSQGFGAFLEVVPGAVFLGIVILVLIIIGAVASAGTGVGGLGPVAAALIPIAIAVIIAALSYVVSAILMVAQTYLSLLFNIIFSPIIILFETLNQTVSKMGWIKQIVSDLLVFILLGVIFTFHVVFIETVDSFLASGGVLWSPPYVGKAAGYLKGIVTLGVLALLPNARNLVSQFMKSTFPGIATPREFGKIGGSVEGAVANIQKNLFTKYGTKS